MKDTHGCKGAKNAEAESARDAEREKVAHHAEDVQAGMKCKECGRCCYKTWDNKCAVYTNEFIAEHAKLLVSLCLTSISPFAYCLFRPEESLVSSRTRSRAC